MGYGLFFNLSAYAPARDKFQPQPDLALPLLGEGVATALNTKSTVYCILVSKRGVLATFELKTPTILSMEEVGIRIKLIVKKFLLLGLPSTLHIMLL